MNRPTWILLRGLARESGHWGDFIGLLAERVAPEAVVALDLPGTGEHRNRRSPTSVPAIVAACRADLRRRGVPPPYRLLGVSLGGMVALEWSRSCPDEIAGCMVVNTSMRPHGAWHERLRLRHGVPLALALFGRDAGRVEAAVLRATSSRPERHAQALARWIELRRSRPVTRSNVFRQLWAAARYRGGEQPPATPVRLLCSAADALVSPSCTHRLTARWQLGFDEHPHAGHDLALDDPDWLAERAAAFATASQGKTAWKPRFPGC